MRKWLGWFRTLVIGLALLLLVVLAAGYGLWRYWAPGYLKRQLTAALADAGFTNATFQIETLKPGRLVLVDLTLDESGRLAADRVVARADLLHLLAGRLDSLRVDGVRWQVRLVNGRLDHGLPAAVLDRPGGGSFPIDRLIVRGAVIELTEGETIWEIPILPVMPDKPARPLTVCFDQQQQVFRFVRPPSAAPPDDPLHGLLASFLPGLAYDGAIGLSGQVDLQGGLEASVELKEAVVRLEVPKSRFTDVAGRIDIQGPLWRTTGHPHVYWQAARVGEIDLGPGSLQFQYIDGQPFYVERFYSRMGPTGRLWAHAFEVDTQAVDLKVNLFWEAIDLNDFLSIITAGKATGVGKLYGRLPIRVRTQPRLRLAFGAGYLLADEGGQVRIEDQKLVRQVMADHLPQLGGDVDTQQLVEDRFVQALQDFAYSKLRFALFEQDDQSILRLELAGAGRKVNQELNLTVNFEGIGGLVDVMLRAKLAMAAAEEKLKAGLKPR